jgi:thiol-disulfide isomerase/thioredoxin
VGVIGLWIAVAAVVLALGFGGYRRLRDGRFRGPRAATELPKVTSRPAESDLSALGLERLGLEGLGERATLVQFSSAFCAPCRATRRILSDVARVVPGVVHVEIDAEMHLETVRRLGIVRTPTTLILDATGREIARAAGAPRKEQVLSALP